MIFKNNQRLKRILLNRWQNIKISYLVSYYCCNSTSFLCPYCFGDKWTFSSFDKHNITLGRNIIILIHIKCHILKAGWDIINEVQRCIYHFVCNAFYLLLTTSNGQVTKYLMEVKINYHRYFIRDMDIQVICQWF